MFKPERVELFWSRVARGAPDECWLFNGPRHPRGYGIFDSGAHRFSLELKLGRLLEPGEMATHTCDNPPCVNPAHLRLGNAKSNAGERYARAGLPRPKNPPSPYKPRAPRRPPNATHCNAGHELTPENLYRSGACKICTKERAKARYRSLIEAAGWE